MKSSICHALEAAFAKPRGRYRVRRDYFLREARRQVDSGARPFTPLEVQALEIAHIHRALCGPSGAFPSSLLFWVRPKRYGLQCEVFEARHVKHSIILP